MAFTSLLGVRLNVTFRPGGPVFLGRCPEQERDEGFDLRFDFEIGIE